MNQVMGQFIQVAHKFQKIPMHSIFHEVSHGEWMLLGAIENQGKENTKEAMAGTGQFAKVLKCSPPMISKILGSLEKKGYIRREISRKDRRNTCIYLTPEGQRVLDEGKDKMDILFDRIVSRIGEEQMKKMVADLEQLQEISLEELTKMEEK